ncbi:hypothetical protein [Streptomyces sp. NPDC044948]|uniref:hypothetical protein n=1 Tax=Streptomyces sp. NPDC044948 TaxID=3157092 RepID=UPI0033F2406F
MNGKVGPDIVLSAGDVGAVANSGGYSRMDGMLHLVYKGTSADVFKASNADQTLYTAINKDAELISTATATLKDLRIGSGATFGGGSGGVLAFVNASTVPTANPIGAVMYAEGGVLKVRQSDGKTFAVGASGGAKNAWTPQALGFQAWSVDPATVANPKNWNATSGGVIKAASIQRMYLAGMNITEPTTVSKVVIFARGWGGSSLVPNARFMAGIYDSTGKRLAYTGTTPLSNVPAAGQQAGTPSDAKNSHIGAVPFTLTSSYTLQPGLYWAAFLMPAGGSADFYYMHIENESPSNPSNFHLLSPAFMRAGYIAGQTTLPASFTPSSLKLDHDPCIMALA